ncbi:MAG: carboxypeptidase regulatory-like domain-containing protein [Deltaproteobacteria bacterium]|nr:carboxypeptidase regulatory-like domain-containing protein [Deltaproteobacteria bacterium]
MSEDRPGDDAAASEPVPAETAQPDAPPPASEDPAASTRSRRPLRPATRIAILVAIGLVVIGSAVLVRRSQRSSDVATQVAEGSGAGAAIRAPEGPSVPGDPGGVRLTGFVIDGAGLPVIGAEVTAELEKGAADRSVTPAVPAAPPPSPMPMPLAADAGVTPGVFVASPTALDGRFVILGLEPGRYRVRVTGSGLLPAEVRYVPVPSDAARIVVSRRVAIAGTVVDAGKPAPNVTIGLRGDAIGGGIELKSSVTGEFAFEDLPEGRYQLFAYQGALAARAVRVSRLGTGPFAPIELRLEAAAIVVGRVLDRAEGTGIAAAIELRPSGDDQAPRYARSGPDGVFRIEGVPNGRWIADAFSPGYLSTGGVELEAGRGVPELALSKGAIIEGRVLDGEGRPIAGATVRALVGGTAGTETSQLVQQDMLRRFSGRIAAPTAAPGTMTSDPQFIARGELGVTVGPIPPIPPPGAQASRPAVVDPSSGVMAQLAGDPPPLPVDPFRASIWTTGPDGRYRIRGLAKGKVAVLAVAPGFAEGRSKENAVDIGHLLTDIDIVLSPGTFVIGKVTDQHNVSVIGAMITATPPVGAPIVVFTDEAGEYRLGPIVGTLDIVATAYGHGDARRKLDVPVARGPTPAELRESFVLVVADATLAGTLDDANGAPVAAAHLEVTSGSGEGRHAVVAADGTFSIDMLPAGPLRVRIRHPDYPEHELETAAVSGGKERVRLRLPIGGAIEGAVIEATSGAPLAGITIAGAGPGGASTDATSDKIGHWRLGPLVPGRWKLTIKLPGYLPLAHELDVAASRTPGTTSIRDIRLELARGALVGGTLRDARGQRVSGATIAIRATRGGGPTVEGMTDAEGEFRIRDAPSGEIEIVATSVERTGTTRVTVRPGDEVLGLAVELGR